MLADNILDLGIERLKRGGGIPLHDDVMAVVLLHRDGSVRTFTSPELDTDSADNQETIVTMLGHAARSIMEPE
jgi:hypothetical protein